MYGAMVYITWQAKTILELGLQSCISGGKAYCYKATFCRQEKQIQD